MTSNLPLQPRPSARRLQRTVMLQGEYTALQLNASTQWNNAQELFILLCAIGESLDDLRLYVAFSFQFADVVDLAGTLEVPQQEIAVRLCTDQVPEGIE